MTDQKSAKESQKTFMVSSADNLLSFVEKAEPVEMEKIITSAFSTTMNKKINLQKIWYINRDISTAIVNLKEDKNRKEQTLPKDKEGEEFSTNYNNMEEELTDTTPTTEKELVGDLSSECITLKDDEKSKFLIVKNQHVPIIIITGETPITENEIPMIMITDETPISEKKLSSDLSSINSENVTTQEQVEKWITPKTHMKDQSETGISKEEESLFDSSVSSCIGDNQSAFLLTEAVPINDAHMKAKHAIPITGETPVSAEGKNQCNFSSIEADQVISSKDEKKNQVSNPQLTVFPTISDTDITRIIISELGSDVLPTNNEIESAHVQVEKCLKPKESNKFPTFGMEDISKFTTTSERISEEIGDYIFSYTSEISVHVPKDNIKTKFSTNTTDGNTSQTPISKEKEDQLDSNHSITESKQIEECITSKDPIHMKDQTEVTPHEENCLVDDLPSFETVETDAPRDDIKGDRSDKDIITDDVPITEKELSISENIQAINCEDSYYRIQRSGGEVTEIHMEKPSVKEKEEINPALEFLTVTTDADAADSKESLVTDDQQIPMEEESAIVEKHLCATTEGEGNLHSGEVPLHSGIISGNLLANN